MFYRENSLRRCFVKRGVHKNFAKFTGQHLCWSFFFNKVTGLRSATLLKKRLWHRCFSVDIAKFLRAPICERCFCIGVYKFILFKRELSTSGVIFPFFVIFLIFDYFIKIKKKRKIFPAWKPLKNKIIEPHQNLTGSY